MTGRARRSTIQLAREAGTAFAASVAFFVLAAAAIPVRHVVVVIVLLGAIYIYAVVRVGKRRGPLYGVPMAIAAGLAFDSFYIPPTRDFGADDWQNWLVIAIYIGMGVVIGRFAAHTQRRTEVAEHARGVLAEEQAALRRVATLVARDVPPEQLFAAVAEEVGTLLGTDRAGLIRYDSDNTMSLLVYWSASGDQLDVRGRWRLDGGDLGTKIAQTGRPARIDDYEGVPGRAASLAREVMGVRSAVGCPIVVEGRLWGALLVHSTHREPLPADTESRLGNFTALVATAISNAHARAEVDRLADEQAALRRVATLVAHQTSPEEVFTAIAEEVGQLLGVEGTRLFRYERDHTATIVAAWGEGVFPVPVGSRVTLDGDNVASLVLRTERPARMDDYAKATGYLAAAVRERGVRSVVGAPILVAGRVWGAVVALSRQHESLAADFEARIGEFAELAGTAIANVQARSELAASRARIVAATDQARRQFERDLHDGAQQRLVSLALELREAEATAPAEHDDLRAQLSRAREDLNDVLENLRELSRGIHPAILSEGGLAPALRALKRRAALPIDLDVRVHGRLEEQVEVAAYYVVSEALTNAAKHAHASSAEVHAEVRDGALDLTIRDDGIGGADVGAGTGLTGLSDRVEALGGKLAIASSPGEGTSLHVELPLAAAAPPAPR